jgi:hypothetical protein
LERVSERAKSDWSAEHVSATRIRMRMLCALKATEWERGSGVEVIVEAKEEAWEARVGMVWYKVYRWKKGGLWEKKAEEAGFLPR